MSETSDRKKNIILFTGPNRIARERELALWVRAFERKYWADQIARLDASSVAPDALRSELASMWLFATTKLVILSGWATTSADERGAEEAAPKSDPSSAAADIVLSLADRIPDTTFVLIHAPSLDRRSKFSKYLEKSCTVKSYEAATEHDVRAYAEDHGLAPDAARLLALRYRDDLEGAARLVETLSLYRADAEISRADVEAHAPVPPAESIFPAVDAVLARDGHAAADTVMSLLERESVYALLASLISNLRSAVLVGRLAEEGMDADAIGGVVKMHPFVLKKNLAARKHLPAISRAYAGLLDIDRRVKTGRALGSDERGVELLLDACLRSGGACLPSEAEG